MLIFKYSFLIIKTKITIQINKNKVILISKKYYESNNTNTYN